MSLWSRISGKTTLEAAAQSGKIRAAKAAIQRGVTQVDLSHCIGYAEHSGLAMVQLLVSHGANVNHQPGGGRMRPLHLAAASGYTDIAAFLIQMGADVNATDHVGDTAPRCQDSCRPLTNSGSTFRAASKFRANTRYVSHSRPESDGYPMFVSNAVVSSRSRLPVIAPD